MHRIPIRSLYVVEMLDGISGFFRAITEELRSSPAHEQELAAIYEELEELRGTVQEIKDQGVHDRQVLLETGQRLERLANLTLERVEATLERVEALERSLKPQEIEEARWLKRILEWLKYLILLLLVEMAKALYEAGVQEKIYPELKERLQQLGNRIDQPLERLEHLIAAPEPAPKPAREPRSVPATSLEPEMILIPAGRFIMGSDLRKDKLAYAGEQPQHTLYLPDYYIARTPVTNVQYGAFVRATGHRTPYHLEDGKIPRGEEQHPVTAVSWNDAIAYCRWLSEVAGKSYCLPSEAEWEKAARGMDGRIYPWGNRWDASRCNCWESGPRGTTPVGAYPRGASPYGVLDMAGNVWEWTRSLYRGYPYDSTDGREDLGVDGHRVLRGGSFYKYQRYVRCASRLRDYPFPSSRLGTGNWYRYYGFRVVVSPFTSEL